MSRDSHDCISKCHVLNKPFGHSSPKNFIYFVNYSDLKTGKKN